MLIDKLKRINPLAVFPEAADKKLKDAITFFIDENSEDFLEKMLGKTYKPILPSKLPYNNIFLQLKDTGVWVVADDNRLYLNFLVSNIEKQNRFKLGIQDNTPVFYISAGFSEDNILSDIKEHTLEKYKGLFIGRMIDLPIAILMEFLNILTCKNIKTKKICANKKRFGTNKPLFSYYILQIVSKKIGGISEAKEIWSNRIHLCRGHIKTYTKEKPLFGKIAGNIWCPPHARGNKEIGIIAKDYKI